MKLSGLDLKKMAEDSPSELIDAINNNRLSDVQLSFALEYLGTTEHPDRPTVIARYLSHPHRIVREGAIMGLQFNDTDREWAFASIKVMSELDESPGVRAVAKEFVSECDETVLPLEPDELPAIHLVRVEEGAGMSASGLTPYPWRIEVYSPYASWVSPETAVVKVFVGRHMDVTVDRDALDESDHRVAMISVHGKDMDELATEAQEIGAALVWSALRAVRRKHASESRRPQNKLTRSLSDIIDQTMKDRDDRRVELMEVISKDKD